MWTQSHKTAFLGEGCKVAELIHASNRFRMRSWSLPTSFLVGSTGHLRRLDVLVFQLLIHTMIIHIPRYIEVYNSWTVWWRKSGLVKHCDGLDTEPGVFLEVEAMSNKRFAGEFGFVDHGGPSMVIFGEVAMPSNWKPTCMPIERIR